MSATAAVLRRDDQAQERSLQEYIARIGRFFGPIAAGATEITRLIPDSILFGSFLLYVITQNLSYGVFSLFLFETSLLHQLTGFIVQQTVGPVETGKAACVSGFRNPRLALDRMRNQRPQNISPFAFYIGAILVYVCAAAAQFKETLDVMGPDWSGRFYFVVVMAPIIAAAMLFLYYWSGCYTLAGGGLAIGAGLVAGGVLYFLNQTLFGPEGMNFLGLPFLVSKIGAGGPIYICSAAPITPPNQ